ACPSGSRRVSHLFATHRPSSGYLDVAFAWHTRRMHLSGLAARAAAPAGQATVTPMSPLPPRRELLETRHLSLPTLLASAAVLLSTDREGRVRRGAAAQWLSGVSLVRAQCQGHRAYWQRLAAEAETGTGPLWVALGDSSAQGVGAADPQDGYVGRV